MKLKLFHEINKKMFRCYPRRKKGPRIYSKPKTKEILEKEYAIWREKNPHMTEFTETEMYFYLNKGWCIQRTINYRLHGIYDKWITENPDVIGFSEREFDEFLDNGKSIEEIFNSRLEYNKYKKNDINNHYPEELFFYVESISTDDESEIFELRNEADNTSESENDEH